MKKIVYLGLLSLATLFLVASCNNDDDNPTLKDVDPEIALVIEALKDVKDVSLFTKVLTDNASDIKVKEGNITVFAVKNVGIAPSSDDIIGKDNITRHIVEGVYDLTAFTADTLFAMSLSGDPVAITKVETRVFVNGVAVESNEPVKAGKNMIYKVAGVVPHVKRTAQKSAFEVYEINEKWTNAAIEKALSDDAQIDFFRYVNLGYVNVGTVRTAKGKATFDHYYGKNLFYTVTKDKKTSLREDYQVVGLFTSQEQIDSAPEYQTGTYLDKLGLGKLRITDMNSDGVINENDKIKNGYLKIDMAADATEAVIVSNTYGVEGN